MRQIHWQLGVIVGVSLVLAACTETKPKPAVAAAPPPTAGAQMCVRLTQIRESRIVSDSVIDFVMNDGSIYRNTLPIPCPGLAINRAFGYETSINDLCSVNTITVIVQGGGPVKGSICGLGQFVPYTPPPKATPVK